MPINLSACARSARRPGQGSARDVAGGTAEGATEGGATLPAQRDAVPAAGSPAGRAGGQVGGDHLAQLPGARRVAPGALRNFGPRDMSFPVPRSVGFGPETFIFFSFENKLYIIYPPLEDVCAEGLLPGQWHDSHGTC